MTAPKPPTPATCARYGGTVEDWKRLYEAQDGKCAMCKKRFTANRPPHIDHNHATGEWRGLLCQFDNDLLGYLHEDVDRFRNAYRYLISPPSRGVFDVPRIHRDAPPHRGPRR